MSGSGGRLRGVLERPQAPAVIIAIALLLVLPCLSVGWAADDHILRIILLEHLSLPGWEREPWNLFTFATGEPSEIEALRETGTFSWWVSEQLRLDFWRPLSAMTHWLDFVLWPEAVWAMYLHSIAWFAVLLVLLGRLYEQLHAPHGRWVGVLALALFAFDDARGPTVGWISNRNALVMASFAAATLLAHHAWRSRGWRPGLWLAPLMLLASLCSAEGAVAVLGYLLAYTVFVDRAPMKRRLFALMPLLLTAAGWAITYKLLGKGTHASGVYLDPLAEPLLFWRRAMVRIPVLLQAQVAGPWSDLWPAYPPQVAAAVLAAGVLLMAGVVALLWPLRREPVARMWGCGAVLACVPIAGTFPADRLLTLVGFGAMGLLAMGLSQLAAPQTARWRRTGLLGVLGLHLVIAPLLLPIRVRSMQSVQRTLALLDRAVPKDSSVTEQTLVVLASPNDSLVSYLPFLRASRDEPAPDRLRLLATSFAPVRVERLDANTLRLMPADGFLPDMSNRMLRGPGHPFSPGERIVLSDLNIEITAVTTDGRPAVVTFVFDRPLEHPSLLWRVYDDGAFVAWTPPPVGRAVELPPVDLERLARVLLQ